MTEQKFKVGDRVEVADADAPRRNNTGTRFYSLHEGKRGIIVSPSAIYGAMHYTVRFDDGTTDDGGADALRLIEPNPIPTEFTINGRAFKVGGRFGQPLISVRFDDGEEDNGGPDALRLIEAASPSCPIPTEFTINGRRYVLAEEEAPAAEPEPKREPKRGEIWRDAHGGLWLRPEQYPSGNARWVALGSADRTRYANGYVWAVECPGHTFAYPSLAAAIAAGEKFK